MQQFKIVCNSMPMQKVQGPTLNRLLDQQVCKLTYHVNPSCHLRVALSSKQLTGEKKCKKRKGL